MKKPMQAALLLFAVVSMYGQDAVATSGGDASGSRGSTSYSVGQVHYSADVGKEASSFHGVQYAYEIKSVFQKKADLYSNLNFSAFPNPTQDLVTVQIDGNVKGDFSYVLYSVSGKRLSEGTMNTKSNVIPMQYYSHGVYLVEISIDGVRVKTFQIIKN